MELAAGLRLCWEIGCSYNRSSSICYERHRAMASLTDQPENC